MAELGARIAVVGLPYVDNPAAVARIAPGDTLCLRPLDNNSYDPHTVEVWSSGPAPFRVGFVERRDALHVRALPGGPEAWQLRVVERRDFVIVAALASLLSLGDATSDGEEEIMTTRYLFSRKG